MGGSFARLGDLWGASSPEGPKISRACALRAAAAADWDWLLAQRLRAAPAPQEGGSRLGVLGSALPEPGGGGWGGENSLHLKEGRNALLPRSRFAHLLPTSPPKFWDGAQTCI